MAVGLHISSHEVLGARGYGGDPNDASGSRVCHPVARHCQGEWTTVSAPNQPTRRVETQEIRTRALAPHGDRAGAGAGAGPAPLRLRR
jgi:hypothetical protein